jgi:hypothetical protein
MQKTELKTELKNVKGLSRIKKIVLPSEGGHDEGKRSRMCDLTGAKSSSGGFSKMVALSRTVPLYSPCQIS